jgi:nitrate reductase delta subunit
MTAQAAMLGFARNKPENSEASDRLRAWTRARFGLTDDATVMVSEVACGLPGCPPVETHLVFWTALGRHHFQIFKPLADVVVDDLPPAFMKNALIARDGADVDCC